LHLSCPLREFHFFLAKSLLQHQIRRMNLGGRAAPLPHSRRLIVQQIVSNSDSVFFYSCQIFANTVNCAFFLLSLRKPKKKTMRLPKPRPKNNNQKRKPTSLSKSKSLQPVRNGIEGKLGAEIGLFDSRWVLGLLGGPACLGLEREKMVQGGDCRVPSGSSFPPRFSDGCSGPSLASRRCGISTTTLFRKRILSRRLAWFVFDSFSSTVAINEFSVPTSVACFGNYPSWIAILILIA